MKKTIALSFIFFCIPFFSVIAQQFDSLLFEAVYSGNLQKVKELVQKGAHVNVKSESGDTPLHFAPSAEIAGLLIEKGADVNAVDNEGQTPLHLVQNSDVARILIEKGADIHAQDSTFGYTPLHLTRSVEIAKVLIEKGADVNEKSGNSGDTPLHFAETAEMAAFLIEKGADINAKNSMGLTPLNTARTPELALFLIEKGADLDSKSEDGYTPLVVRISEIASFLEEKTADYNADKVDGYNYFIGQDFNISRLLIEKGANVNQNTQKGETLLSVAIKSSRLDIVSWLIGKGANVNALANDLTAPLFVALERDQPDIARLLINNGADINIKNNDGNSPLFIALEKDQSDLVSLLIKKGSDGSTLISFLEELNYEAASELLEKGFKIDSRNTDGQTALIMAAIKTPRKEVIKFLLDHKADSRLKDKKGKTALDYAKLLGKTDFVGLLLEPELIKTLRINGQQAVIEMLKKGKNDIDKTDFNGSTLLHNMVYQSCDTLLDYVIKNYKNTSILNILNSEHQSPLLYAIYLKNDIYALGLIEAGADPNLEGKYGETPLYMAEYRGMSDVVSILNEKKAIRKTAVYPTELSLPLGHHESIKNVSISPDGKTIISDDRNFATILWDIATGKEIRSFAGRNSGACISPDGKSFLSASAERNIKLWDIETGQVLRNYTVQKNGFYCFTLSPDGKSFLSSGDSSIILWDITTGKKLKSFTGDREDVTRLTFSPDGKFFISETFPGSPNNSIDSVENNLKLWNIATGKEVNSFKVDKYWVTRWPTMISFSPDGKSFISSHIRGIINLQDATTGKELRSFTGHYEWLECVCFSPDGRNFVSGYSDGTISIWDVATGKELKNFTGHQFEVTSIGFLPDGNSFISAGYREYVRQWDINSGTALQTFRGYSRPTETIEITKDGSKIIVMNSLEVKLMDIVSGKGLQNINKGISYESNTCMRISPDGKSFVSAIYGIEDTTLLYNPNFENSVIKLFDIYSGKEIRTFEKHKGEISDLCFSPDGKSFISENRDQTILWDIASGNVIKTLYGGKSRFLADGKSLVSVGEDNSIKIWDIATGEVAQSFIGPVRGEEILNFSPDGKTFVYNDPDYTFKIWDIAKGENLQSFSGHYDEVKSICFPQDGKTILSGSWDNTIRLWDVSTGLPIRTYKGHALPVTDVKLHPSGKFFVSCSWDRTVRFWNIDSTKEIASLVFTDSTDWVLFSPDKYYATTKNGAKKLAWVKGTQVWNFDQWDLQYNRPDIVFSRMPDPDTAMIKMYYKAYQKRLKKMKFQESMFKSGFHTPEIEIEKQTRPGQQTLALDVAAIDTLYSMDRINVWVNDVPVYGINGMSLRNEKQSIGVPVKKQLSLALSEGDNKIEVSVLNSAGVESLKQTAYAKNEGSPVKKDLYFIGISCADYMNSKYNLKYSVKDGRDMARQFSGAKETYANIFIDTLFNINATRENVAALKQKLLRSKVDDQVVLFVSGHGLLDDSLDFYFATYDIDFTHPEMRGISFDDLENILDSIPAREKLFMMDACHSGEVDKEEMMETAPVNTVSNTDITFRGNVKEYNTRGNSTVTQTGITLNNSFELMQELFSGLDKGTGTTVISAAAGKGYALESPQWNNGVFTYSIINGLKNHAADKNKDGTITISELKDYSIKQVQLLTGGRQKPTARRESINYDWKIW